MAHFLITTCCKEKNPAPGLLPAIARYRSRRIAWVQGESLRQELPMLILSGKFGLLRPQDPIPWYDQPLTADAVPNFLPVVVNGLARHGITRVRFVARAKETPGWAPYHAVIEQACESLGISLVWRAWPDAVGGTPMQPEYPS